MSCLYFTDKKVTNYETAKTSDVKQYASYFNYMLEHGIYLAPAQFEAMFLSTAHTKEQLDQTLNTIEDFIKR